MINHLPDALESIEKATEDHGFTMPSDRKTGSLLRTLAASKPSGRFLEIGTGTGLATSWLLDGMCPKSRLDSVDNDSTVLAIAKLHLGEDTRVEFHNCKGEEFIAEASSYDFIFADAWPGKYSHLEETLGLLNQSGIYFIDDMIAQPNWPEGHEKHVDQLLEDLENRPYLSVCKMNWSTGIVISVRTA